MKEKYGVCALCSYLCCSRSGYYDWVWRGKPVHNKIDTEKAAKILSVYLERKTRGRRQVQMQLERQYNLHMSLGSVHRYMSILNIQSLRKRRFIPLSKKTQNMPNTFQNVLKQNFCVSDASHKWLTDITYLHSRDGTEYLSCIKNLKDKSIIAYHISNKNDLSLVMETLKKAIPKIQHSILLHSDQGSQYHSPVYHRFLSEHGITGSMSRKGTPYDNAPIESFFSALKNEELKLFKGLTMQQTRKKVARFIHYYNYERPQWGLQKLTPIEYGRQLV
ncbi:MAG: IS3 family transposase [Clostridia bacterium]|nr:IS3 family transposase [Clostridia bacterium]